MGIATKTNVTGGLNFSLNCLEVIHKRSFSIFQLVSGDEDELILWQTHFEKMKPIFSEKVKQV